MGMYKKKLTEKKNQKRHSEPQERKIKLIIKNIKP